MAIEVIKIPAQGKEDKVYEIRGKRVMIDRDLAECFGVETKYLNRVVKRNVEKFASDDYMLQLNHEECLRCQIVTLNTNQGQHLKYLPNAFTEEGVRALAQVLKRQVDVNFEPPIEDAKILPELWNKGTVVLYQPNNNTSLEVRVVEGTVWLTQEQIAKLFDVGQPAISKHLSNIFMEEEFEKSSVHSILEYTASDGKKYSTQFYNLDAILSVGYRVNSKSATRFRKWATLILKNYLIKGYSINQQLLYAEQRIDHRLLEHDKRLDAVEEKIDFIVDTVYHIGASIKDLGKKLFAFNRMEMKTEELLSHISPSQL